LYQYADEFVALGRRHGEMITTKVPTKPRVLVIDDEEVVRLLFQNMFADEGYETLLAEDGHEGIALLDRYAPPLVLVDKNLPDISGVDLIANQKLRHPNTEFIMITGYASLDSAVKAMEVGAFSYLTKPFEDMEVVMDRVRAALEVNNLRNETALLRDRIERISETHHDTNQPETLKAAVFDQLRHTLSFLESFHDKRDQPPPPPIWARMVDMIEDECRRLKKILETGNPKE
jgi:DNA-binding NtrC family response regulator